MDAKRRKITPDQSLYLDLLPAELMSLLERFMSHYAYLLKMISRVNKLADHDRYSYSAVVLMLGHANCIDATIAKWVRNAEEPIPILHVSCRSLVALIDKRYFTHDEMVQRLAWQITESPDCIWVDGFLDWDPHWVNEQIQPITQGADLPRLMSHLIHEARRYASTSLWRVPVYVHLLLMAAMKRDPSTDIAYELVKWLIITGDYRALLALHDNAFTTYVPRVINCNVNDIYEQSTPLQIKAAFVRRWFKLNPDHDDDLLICDTMNRTPYLFRLLQECSHPSITDVSDHSWWWLLAFKAGPLAVWEMIRILGSPAKLIPELDKLASDPPNPKKLPNITKHISKMLPDRISMYAVAGWPMELYPVTLSFSMLMWRCECGHRRPTMQEMQEVISKDRECQNIWHYERTIKCCSSVVFSPDVSRLILVAWCFGIMRGTFAKLILTLTDGHVEIPEDTQERPIPTAGG